MQSPYALFICSNSKKARKIEGEQHVIRTWIVSQNFATLNTGISHIANGKHGRTHTCTHTHTHRWTHSNNEHKSMQPSVHGVFGCQSDVCQGLDLSVSLCLSLSLLSSLSLSLIDAWMNVRYNVSLCWNSICHALMLHVWSCEKPCPSNNSGIRHLVLPTWRIPLTLSAPLALLSGHGWQPSFQLVREQYHSSRWKATCHAPLMVSF